MKPKRKAAIESSLPSNQAERHSWGAEEQRGGGERHSPLLPCPSAPLQPLWLKIGFEKYRALLTQFGL